MNSIAQNINWIITWTLLWFILSCVGSENRIVKGVSYAVSLLLATIGVIAMFFK